MYITQRCASLSTIAASFPPIQLCVRTRQLNAIAQNHISVISFAHRVMIYTYMSAISHTETYYHSPGVKHRIFQVHTIASIHTPSHTNTNHHHPHISRLSGTPCWLLGFAQTQSEHNIAYRVGRRCVFAPANADFGTRIGRPKPLAHNRTKIARRIRGYDCAFHITRVCNVYSFVNFVHIYINYILTNPFRVFFFLRFRVIAGIVKI